MLKMTKIRLQKIDDIDMHLFIEKGMSVGISCISKRHAKVDDNKTIMYRDANNLYGWAMIQSLPACDFKWLSKKQINDFVLDSIDESSSIGYILECDLEYCKTLHDLHNEYRLCPENVEVSSDIVKIL